MICASGDTGAYSDSVEDRLPKHHPKRLDPTIPPSSPYITAVGGSQFVPAVPAAAVPALQANRSSLLGGTVIGEEMGVMVGGQDDGPWVVQGSSGGGFSNYQARPSYQDSAVSEWLAAATQAKELPPPHMWNSTGSSRGYPDVTALAGLPAEGGPSDGAPTGCYTNHYVRQAGSWVHMYVFPAASRVSDRTQRPLTESILAQGRHFSLIPTLRWAGRCSQRGSTRRGNASDGFRQPVPVQSARRFGSRQARDQRSAAVLRCRARR